MDSSASTVSNKSNNNNTRLPAPSGKYQRRKRVYEKLRARVRGEALPAVPEEEGQYAKINATDESPLGTYYISYYHDDGARKRRILQILGILFTLLVGMAGIQQTVVSAKRWMTFSSSSTMGEDGKPGTASSLVSATGATRRHWDGDWPSDEDEAADDDNYDEEDDNAVEISDALRFMVDIREPLHATDRALFWVVPRAGSTTVKHIVSRCFGLLSATEAGAASTGADANYLTTVNDLEGGEYLNVDASTIEGIEHAADLEAGNLPDLQVVASSYLYEAADKLFSDYYRGRVFSMLRHPIERAGSLFYAMADDPNSNKVVGMSLEDYANSDVAERNWMTRFLSNKPETEDLTEEDVAVAKQVLRKKVLVGLLKYKGESMRRFEEYFGWSSLMDRDERTSECHNQLLEWAWPSKHKHPAVREGSEAWRILSERNDLDMEVYRFAEHLFEQQGQRLFSKPTNQFGLR